MDASSFAYDVVKDLVLRAVSLVIDDPAQDFFTRRKIKARLEDATARFVEQLVPFLQAERITEEQQVQLLSACERELRALLEQPRRIFAGSLDGQKIFDDAYAVRQWPEEVAHEPLRHLYSLIFPQIANVLCTFPPALEQWKAEGFREGFRRLDEIAVTLGDIAARIDALASGNKGADATLFARAVQSLAQRVEFKLELTGLRADRPDAVSIEKCFVTPAFRPGRGNFHRHSVNGDKILAEGADVVNALSVAGSRSHLFGLPGAGKSTFSLWLQRELLTKRPPRLAIHVKLRETARSNSHLSFFELVRVAAGVQLRDEITPEIARRWADDGRLYFIFDGFDEVPSNGRDKAEAWIEELSHAVDKSSLLVTSRPLTTNHLLGKDKRWRPFEMMGFDEARVIEYVEKWYQHAPLLKDADREIDAAPIARTWVNDPLLGPLVATPLTLATLLMVHHLDGKLPQGRAKLYERYVDGMLGIWDQRWGISSAIEMRPAQKKLLLTRLGLHLQLIEREELDDHAIHMFLCDSLPKVECSFEPAQVLDHLRERTGLLVGPGTWSFFHKSIAEFFSAAAVNDGDLTDSDGARIDRLSLYARRHEDRWAVVLFFWAGLAAPAELQSFVDMLMSENEEADSLLALSLIHDQVLVHRLPLAWRSPRIRELVRRDYPSHTEAGSVSQVLPRDQNRASDTTRVDNRYYVRAVALPQGLSIDVCVVMTPVRGVGRQLLLHVVSDLLESIRADVSDFFPARGGLIFYIWWYFAWRQTGSRRLEEIVRVTLDPGSGCDRRWLYLASSRIGVRGDVREEIERLDAAFSGLPELQARAFPILLGVVSLVSRDSHPARGREEEYRREISSLLSYAADRGDPPISDTALLETTAYTLSRHEFEKLDGDVVEAGERAIAQLVKGGWLRESDPGAERVAALVGELRTRRTKLSLVAARSRRPQKHRPTGSKESRGE